MTVSAASGMSTARTQILELHEAWVRAEVEGRTGDLVAMCSHDVVVAPPGSPPVRGKAAVEAFLKAGATSIDEIVIENLAIDILPDLAIKRARFATLLSSAREPVLGWHVWVLRPAWKVAYLTWSVDCAPDPVRGSVRAIAP